MASTRRAGPSQIVRACRQLAAWGFTPATDGNVSVRTDARTILITASGSSFSSISASDMVKVRLDSGLPLGKRRPSSELPTHLALYRRSEEIGAVVHAHPRYATAFAASGTRLVPNVFPEAILDLGDVPLVRYAMPSSGQLGEMVARHASTGSAALLANHGAVTWGRTLDEAMRRMQTLEHIASIELSARALGGVRELAHEQVRELLDHHPLSSRGHQ